MQSAVSKVAALEEKLERRLEHLVADQLEMRSAGRTLLKVGSMVA